MALTLLDCYKNMSAVKCSEHKQLPFVRTNFIGAFCLHCQAINDAILKASVHVETLKLIKRQIPKHKQICNAVSF